MLPLSDQRRRTIGYIFWTIRSNRQASIGTGGVQPTKKLDLPVTADYSIDISLNVAEKDFNFPKSVAALTVEQSPALTSDEITTLAKNLGFEGEAIVSEDALQGTVYIYSDLEKYLTAYTKQANITYGLNDTFSKRANKNLSQEAIINTAKDFLTSKKFVSGNVFFNKIAYLKATDPTEAYHTTTKEGADLATVSFSYFDTDYSIVTTDPEGSSLEVWVLNDGTVSKVSLTKVKSVKQAETKFNIKDYNQVVSTLGEAVLIELNEGNSPIPQFKNAVSDVKIAKIELGYLFENKTTILQPVFILTGDAKVINQSSREKVVFYLPAAVNP